MLNALQNIKQLVTDGIKWKAQKLKDAAGDNLYNQGKAFQEIAKTISLVQNEWIREQHIEKIAPLFKTKIKVMQKAVEAQIKAANEDDEEEDEETYVFPKFMDKDHKKQIMDNGFTMVEAKGNRRAHGIHVSLNDRRMKKISNFILQPLYLVTCQDPNDNKQLFIVSSASEKAVIEFARSSVISVERFRATVHAKHNFMYSGNVDHLMLVMESIGEKVPTCQEVTVLGWQPEGFFAYPDKFFSDGELIDLNEYGIGAHGPEDENGKKPLYFSPSRSILYKNSRQDDNIYALLSALNFKQSPISFEEWAVLMDKTYPTNGKYAIAFAFICLFRDIVLKKDGSCPHLYAWGAPGSGKSKMMESLACLFYQEPRKYPLNSGTDFGLSRFVEIYRNCFNFINELDEETVKPHWLQWIKGWFDNEGRPKGTGKKNMTEVMKCNSAVGLAGQKLVNGDNNALPQRCIVLEFKSLEKTEIPKAQMAAFNTLKKYEENGGFNSVLTEILPHRKQVQKEFDGTFNEIFLAARESIKELDYKWHERIARNYCYILTMAKIFEPLIKLPWKYEEFRAEAIEAINELAIKITTTDVSAAFWQVVSLMADKRILVRGLHYEIESVKEIKLNDDYTHKFEDFTNILIIRLSTVHQYYLENVKRQSSREGMNKSSLESYLKNKDYWVGPKEKRWFEGIDQGIRKKVNTSCHVFNYDLMAKEGYFMDFETGKVEVPTPKDGNNKVVQDDLPF